MIGTGLIVYPLVESTPPAAWSWASVGVGLAVLVAFGVLQRRASGRGLVEVSLFARRVFPAALVTSIVFFAVTSGLTLVVVLHMQLGLGPDVLTAGLTLLPWSVGMGVATWVAGAFLVPRYGGALMFVGLGVLLIGLVGAIAAFAEGAAAALVALGVVGIGVGLFTTSFFTTALHAVQPQEVGSAAGLINAVQQLGATLGVAVLGSLYLAGAGVQVVLWAAAALVLVCGATAAQMRA